MPARKAAGKKASTKKSSKAAAPTKTGPVPPYGDPIRGAIARGDVQEMKNVAANARKWVSDVQAALKQLDSAIKKAGK
jgi:uncharacterized protein DUF1843